MLHYYYNMCGEGEALRRYVYKWNLGNQHKLLPDGVVAGVRSHHNHHKQSVKETYPYKCFYYFLNFLHVKKYVLLS